MHKLIKDNVGWIIAIFSAFVIGIFIGKLIQNVPLLQMDYKVGITDLTNFILTLVVACLIPLSLSPLISDKRVIKDFLIGEFKSCIEFLGKIKDKIDETAISGVTSKEDKLRINSMISRDLGLKIGSIDDQLNASYEGKSKDLRSKIQKAHQEYWQNTTGGELMGDSFKFDIRFCTTHDRDFAKLEACLKRAIHEINKY